MQKTDIIIPNFAFLLLCLLSVSCTAQQATRTKFSRQDTLKGSVTAERSWWDVLRYEVTIEPDFERKTIAGKNVVTFQAVQEGQLMQIDLVEPLAITSVLLQGKKIRYVRTGNVYYLRFDAPVPKGTRWQIEISYEGKPHVAKNPPWDGGWIWERDKEGNPWMSVACQTVGGSIWYPCKDHQSDEPESAAINIMVSNDLVGVGNGQLIAKTSNAASLTDPTVRKTRYSWEVKSTINNYNLIPYIGKYVHWSDSLHGQNGRLSLDYWVLSYNERKAKDHFSQVKGVLTCFEHWFGPYPFYDDGYKLVQSPHLGMEHQSAIAYGNKFMNGYQGKDLSGTGWGKKWDFIIVHESGHEWFGNSITTEDIADMWVHEGFANYSEVLYTECQYGKEAGIAYCIGLRKNIQNDRRVTGIYGVHNEGSGDMYYKASNLIHMIRQLIDDDSRFRELLRTLNKKYFQSTVTGHEIEKFISHHAGVDLTPVFDQYLRTTQIPDFEYSLSAGKLQFRWSNCVEGFNMPVRILTEDNQWLRPTSNWQTIDFTGDKLQVDPNFYVGSKKL